MPEPRPLRVLIVCTGNTCRSPMAEVLLRQLLAEAGRPADIRSAGTHAVEGAPANPNAVAAAAAAGLNLASHRAQPLTADAVHWADVILGMESAHLRGVRELDPVANARLVTAFDPGRGVGDGGVRDPIGWPLEVYVEVLEGLRSCLEGFVRDLDPEARPG